ncbi:hypothetical protein H5410_062069 [Solanum commersonii]|uniref:Uncharacterized protein n=1 Tax=Solanum commersonii TaxID=4109 RepID=A0A9J5WAF3_SOLCO|nr:hypothetical protein H5410_062069 [Solanum commersonii]
MLDALPCYMMSLFLVPTSVTKILDNIRRSFLWQGYKKKKALKIKLLWRYTQQDQILWVRAIKEKNKEGDIWMKKEINTSYGVSRSRSINALWPLRKN